MPLGLGVAGRAELGRRGLAEAHQPGRFHGEHHAVGDLGHEVVVGGGAEGGADAGGEVEVLDRGGQAPERAGTVGWHGAQGGGSLTGLLGGVVHEGADVVEPLDAVEVVLNQLERGRLAAADERPLLEGGQVVELGHAPNLSRDRQDTAVPDIEQTTSLEGSPP